MVQDLYHARGAELRAEADVHRLATPYRRLRGLRTRLGSILMETGLRLTATPGTETALL